jgi:hypothetical protein
LNKLSNVVEIIIIIIMIKKKITLPNSSHEVLHTFELPSYVPIPSNKLNVRKIFVNIMNNIEHSFTTKLNNL